MIRAAAFVLFMATAAVGATVKPDVPLPSMEKRWIGKHNYLSSLVLQASRKPPLDIYFLGDSITEFWPELGKDSWRAEFGKLKVLNCGVSGDTTQNILYRITRGEFDRISPRVIVVLAGINNLGQSPQLEPEDLARGLERIVSKLRARSPGSKILLLSIFPCAEPSDPVRVRILETNKRIAKLSDGASVLYLDIHHAFLDEAGNVPAAISPDGLHLNAKGYQIWADAMRPTLQSLLESSSPNTE